jgi:transcriptional regulator of aromatic amino acid metabolism
MTYSFTVYLDGVGELTDDLVEQLYEVGLDDGTPFHRVGEVGSGSNPLV